jgi:serine/threonine protein kinase
MSADLWALGCIIIKLFTGHTPFEDELEYNVFQKITTADPLFPKEAPKQAIDFMKILLHKDPVHRFGAKFDSTCYLKSVESNYNYDGLKQHPFFDGMEWN